MKIKCVENCDNLYDTKVFTLLVADVPQKSIVKAQKIDGKNYRVDCFGIEVTYNEEGEYLISLNDNQQLYYVDFTGDWHWLDYTLTEAEKTAAIELCKNYLQEEA